MIFPLYHFDPHVNLKGCGTLCTMLNSALFIFLSYMLLWSFYLLKLLNELMLILFFLKKFNVSSKTITLPNKTHFLCQSYGFPRKKCSRMCGWDQAKFHSLPYFITHSQEHPSLGQLSEKLIDNNINVIFAVQGKQFHWYKVCSFPKHKN